MCIAVLDIGTNTVLLLIAEVEGSHIRVIRDDHTIARLGEGVDRTRHINEEAYLRFRGVLQKHLETIHSLNVDAIIAVGTSALRDAENREEIVRRAKEESGIMIEILSGEDEARWSYTGALVDMPEVKNATVIDIGGGSTEISFGSCHEYSSGVSLDIGAVRLTERCFATSPITPEASEDARMIIQASLNDSGIRRPMEIAMLIAVAGTPTTLAAMHQTLEAFDAAKVQDYVLRRAAIDQLLDVLLKTDTATLLGRFPAVNKARANILPAGTLILREAMEYLGADAVRVSTRGLRYGIALRGSS